MINKGILRKTESAHGKEPWTIITVHTNGIIRIQCGSRTEQLSIWRVQPFTDDILLLLIRQSIHQDHKFYFSFSYSHKILHFFDNNTILTSSMTSRIVTVNFFHIKVFSTHFSRLIAASFVGASVISHGIMVRNIAC